MLPKKCKISSFYRLKNKNSYNYEKSSKVWDGSIVDCSIDYDGRMQ